MIKKALSIPSMTSMKDIIEFHKDTEPEIKKPLNFSSIKSVKKVAKPLKEYIENINTNETTEDDIVIGGSSAAYVQIKNFRKPHDLDLYTKKMYELKGDLIKILSKKYKNITSEAITIKRDGSKVIQIKVNDVPVIDIKSHVEKGTILHIFDQDIFYDFRSKPPIKIGNIFYVPASELLARKGQAINRFYYSPLKLGKPIGKRVNKDVKDFYTIKESLDRSKNKPKSSNFGTEGWF